MLDIKDTIRRMSHVGRLIDTSEDSEYIKLADSLFSVERARLEQSIKDTKKSLSDWAGKDLDNFWGSILSLRRIQGVDNIDTFLDDSTYVERIQRFMIAANKGTSLESVRIGAEAGSGVSFSIYSTERGIVLKPHQLLSPSQKEGARRTARRLAPASTIIDFDQSETYSSKNVLKTWSDSNYIGERPDENMTGASFDSRNFAQGVTGSIWSEAPEGSLQPTDGLPSNLLRGGVWHTPSMGFGVDGKLSISTEPLPVNRIRLKVGQGDWYIEYFANNDRIARENVRLDGWEEIEKTFDFIITSNIEITFRNMAQDKQELFVKGLYVGARVDEDTRHDWLAMGGLKGTSEKEVIHANAEGVVDGEEWISLPARSPSEERPFYATLSGHPDKVSALLTKTRSSGALFRIYHSKDTLHTKEDYPDLDWKRLPGIYEMINGRIDISPCRARHIKLVCTNLRPMLLKEYVE